MYFIDTHTHIYDSIFSEDIDEVIERCKEKKVEKLVLPNEDSKTIAALKGIVSRYKGVCYGAVGLHPTSVKADYEDELAVIKEELYANTSCYVAIGEIGLDFYWDMTFQKEQETALKEQLNWARELNLPVIIHSRKAETHVLDILSSYEDVVAILHCWSGNEEETRRAMEYPNVYFGIGGTLTYKKSTIPSLIYIIGIERIVLETDSPYLPPMPFRGKRNESSYIPLIANSLSDILNLPIEEISRVCSENSKKIFKF